MTPLNSLLIAAIGLIAVQLAGRRSPVLTTITLATLLFLPLLAYLPKVHLNLPSTTHLVDSAPSTFFLKLYLGGLILFASKLALDLLAINRWKKISFALPASSNVHVILAEAAQQLHFAHPVQLFIHPHLSSPVASGLFKPAIHLPDSALTWSPATLRCVFLHELGHHARRDLWTALAARLACVLHWFNPFAWILRRQLLAQCEYACDAHVLATGLDPKTYAHTLCDLALPSRNRAPALALAMATKSTLRSRVESLLAPRRPVPILSIALTLLLTLGTALALNTLRPALPESLPSSLWSAHEIDLRHTANPYPANTL